MSVGIEHQKTSDQYDYSSGKLDVTQPEYKYHKIQQTGGSGTTIDITAAADVVATFDIPAAGINWYRSFNSFV